MKKKEYICANCHIPFISNWSDEEAEKEAKELWEIKNASKGSEDTAVICDDCFKMIPLNRIN